MVGINRNQGKKQVLSEINITPFVDVMLVLLIVFMVTSPLLIAGIEVDLPESSASPINASEEPISVTINNDNEVFIQSTKVSLTELKQKLTAITKENLEAVIYVRGDKNVAYGKVIELVNIINQIGYSKVALLTEIGN
jgi:biopolymer transport protein TolR